MNRKRNLFIGATYRPDTTAQIPALSQPLLRKKIPTSFAKERAMATTFWQRLSRDPMISREFQKIAKAHTDALKA